MTTTIRSSLVQCIAVGALFSIVISLVINASSVQAGQVAFEDIIQSTQTPGDPDNLYGEPDTSVPNKLLFPNPSSFAATATGADGVDVTDGFLTFTVKAEAGTWATGLSLAESGSWSLIPSLPGNIAGVRGGGGVTITEVDGAPVAGPVLPILYEETFDMDDTPPDSNIWSGGFVLEFGEVGGKVTAFDVTLNNRVFALSEAGFSFIDKKNISFVVQTEMIPEPSTALLGLMAFSSLGLVVARTRRG